MTPIPDRDSNYFFAPRSSHVDQITFYTFTGFYDQTVKQLHLQLVHLKAQYNSLICLKVKPLKDIFLFSFLISAELLSLLPS